jgi:hypothetical protein
MKNILSKIFPKNINNDYKGYKLAVYAFILYAGVSIVRSCIHFFAPDGGAGSIAKIDLSQGGKNIIFVFALWGSSQLILGFIQLLVSFRYRNLLPFMYILLFLEYSFRTLIGVIKPPIFQAGAGTPPGGYADKIMIPLALIMLVLTLIERKNKTEPEA